MKKIVLGIFVVVTAISIILLFAIYASKDKIEQTGRTEKTANIKPVDSYKVKQTRQIESLTTESEINKGTSAELNKIREYAKEFNLPAELKKELVEAAEAGGVEEQSEDTMTEGELKEMGLMPAQITQIPLSGNAGNITAGYYISDETFDDMIEACLPSSEAEDEETKILKSESLANIGFSAMADGKYSEAEKAFNAVIWHYEDTDAVPMVRLELARLLLEQGRVDEARSVVDEAIYSYDNDDEYIKISKAFIEKIEEYRVKEQSQ